MTDVFSKIKRSEVMSAIKSIGNKTTEIAFKKNLQKRKIKGWRTHAKKLPGKPDFIFLKNHLAVFIDGCFWHGCRICSRNLKSSTNSKFWFNKVTYNRKHDRKVNLELKRLGWRVLRFWEHEVQETSQKCIERLLKITNGRNHE